MKRVKALLLERADNFEHAGSMRNGIAGKRAPWRLGRILSVSAAHVVQALGAIVERRQGLVVDRPGGRHTIDMLHCLEVFASQSEQRASPEFGVSADEVMGIGTKLASPGVHPALLRLVPAIFPDGVRAPVFLFLGNEVPALQNQEARTRIGQRMGERPAPCAASNDDDVVAFCAHHEARTRPV